MNWPRALGDPTHGGIAGDFFYYIANSGWDALDDHGNLKTGATLACIFKNRWKRPRPPNALRRT